MYWLDAVASSADSTHGRYMKRCMQALSCSEGSNDCATRAVQVVRPGCGARSHCVSFTDHPQECLQDLCQGCSAGVLDLTVPDSAITVDQLILRMTHEAEAGVLGRR